jgi:hypothetical protein
MAITTYTELKTAIANWLDRDDLTSVIPDFITIAEKQMEREIRHYKMIERSSGALDSQYSAVPADWLETVRFSITTGDTFKLEMTTLNDMMTRRESNQNTQGRPQFYAHIGETFELFPTPDQTYTMELIYYQDIPKLSASQTTNWLLGDAPDAYLYGSLMQAAPYLGEDERVAIWSSLYAKAVADINRVSLKTSQSSSGMRIQVNTY